MSRKAKIISLEEFKKKCKPLFLDEDGEFEPSYIRFYSTTIEKDLSKIDFDSENIGIGNADEDYSDCSFCNYPAGYEVLENELPVLFVNSGGDWEHPICYCIYWDGKNLRGYIPKDGNVYNRKEKCAFGSEYELSDDDTVVDDLPCGDADKIRTDIINRIKIN